MNLAAKGVLHPASTLTIGVALAALLWIAAACGSEAPLPAEHSAAPAATSADGSASAATSTTDTAAPTPAAGIVSLDATTVASEGMVRPGIGTRAEGLPVPMTAADFPTPPERDLLALAQELRRTNDVSPANATDWQVGDTRDFWTLNYPRLQMERNRFSLVAVSEKRLLVDCRGPDGRS